MKSINKVNLSLIIILILFVNGIVYSKENTSNKAQTTISEEKSNANKIKDKAEQTINKIKKNIKNPNYPKKENDIIVKKGSKIEKFSKKVEKAKKEFYEYIDDDVRPLTLLWTPCINIFWSSSEKLKDIKSWGFDSMNFIRFMIMYDVQLGNSHFFFSPGIGWANQDYVFKDYCLFQPLKKDSKVEFKKAKDLINERVSDELTETYINEVNSIGLYTNYVEFVGELQFRSNKLYYKEGLFAAFGFKFGWLVVNPKSYIEFLDKNSNKNETIKKEHRSKEPLGIDNYKFALLFRFGLGSFGGFVELTLNNILDPTKMKDEKLVLKPITIGITIDVI